MHLITVSQALSMLKYITKNVLCCFVLYQVEKVLFKVPEVSKKVKADEKPRPSDWWVVNAPVFEPVRILLKIYIVQY